VRQAIGDRQAFWLLGSLPDAEAWFTRYQHVEVVLLSDLMVLDADTLRVTLANLDTSFAERTARGEPSFVTSTAFQLCNSLAAAVPNARLLLTWLEQRRGPELAHVDDVLCFALRPAGH